MELVGCYINERNSNLNAFFKSIGVPFVVRVIMKRTRPTVAILRLEDFWSVTVKSLLASREKSFKLGREYVEFLPGRVVKSITTMEDGKLVTRSVTDDKIHTTTTYEITSQHLVITLMDEKSGVEAKRFFKKAPTPL